MRSSSGRAAKGMGRSSLSIFSQLMPLMAVLQPKLYPYRQYCQLRRLFFNLIQHTKWQFSNLMTWPNVMHQGCNQLESKFRAYFSQITYLCTSLLKITKLQSLVCNLRDTSPSLQPLRCHLKVCNGFSDIYS